MTTPCIRDRCLLASAAVSLLLLLSACYGGEEPQLEAVRPETGEAGEDEEAERPTGLVVRKDSAYDGYTLIAPLNSTSVHLVDMAGEVVHTWPTGYAPGAAVYMLESGHLLRCGFVDGIPGFHGGGIGGSIQEIDWDGNVVWEYRLATEAMRQHHDIEPLPNGNLLLIAWEHRTQEEAVARGRDPAHVSEEGLWPDVVQEIRPVRPDGGEVVWTWRSWDHVVQDRDPGLTGFGSPKDHPGRLDINADHRFKGEVESDEERQRREDLEEQMAALGYVGGTPADVAPHAGEDAGDDAGDGPDGDAAPPRVSGDWLHTNSVKWLPEHDLIVLSSPKLCEIFIIDHSTTTEEAASDSGGRWGRGGELLWRWGNPRNYGAGDATDQALFYQHHPTWLADGDALSLLVFNNGGGRPDGSWSSVEELALPFDPQQGFVREQPRRFGPPRPAWIYEDRDDFLSEFISGADRLPNGNTLICSGKDGRVFEVTPAGEILWDWWSPLGGEIEPHEQGGKAPPNALFRATRIAPDHPGLAGRF